MDTSKPVNPVADYLTNMKKDEGAAALPDSVAHLFPNGTGTTVFQPGHPASAPAEQPQEGAVAQVPAPAPVPAVAPAADSQQPAAPAADELATTAGKRPLAHFGQARPVTKSKANRKLVLQLTPEMYQYFAHVSTLPGLDGVPLPDLAVAILHAWREDYRPEVKKANAAFKA